MVVRENIAQALGGRRSPWDSESVEDHTLLQTYVLMALRFPPQEDDKTEDGRDKGQAHVDMLEEAEFGKSEENPHARFLDVDDEDPPLDSMDGITQSDFD